MDANGFKYIIVFIDAFTRFVELRPVKSLTAADAAKTFMEVFGRYGAPKFLRSDNGTQFVAELISELLKLLGIDCQLTLAYHPEANGIVERANGEVMKHLRALANEFVVKDDWATFLPLVQRIVNASPHSSTGIAPARLLFGDLISLNRGLLVPFESVDEADENEPLDKDRE